MGPMYIEQPYIKSLLKILQNFWHTLVRRKMRDLVKLMIGFEMKWLNKEETVRIEMNQMILKK